NPKSLDCFTLQPLALNCFWAFCSPSSSSLNLTPSPMANGLPYTIAAQVAHPERQCVAFVGDGAFSMLMAEFVTAVKYHLPVKIIVIKNNTLGMIKWEQMAFLGNPEFACELQPIDFAAFARACGGSGFTIEEDRKSVV